MTENELATKVIGVCIEIHKQYGPGLLESVYEEIFCYEWKKYGIPFTRQQQIPLIHESLKLDVSFRADVIVDKKLLVDFKAIEKVPPVHVRRVKSYLNLTAIKLGLIINFDGVLLKDGVERVVNGLEDDPKYYG